MRTLLGFGLLALVGCAREARGPVAPSTDHAKGLAAARAPVGRTWKVGVGVEGCALGAIVADCERTLGPAKRVLGYATFEAAGVQAALSADDRVKVVFVIYRAKEGSPFAGSDPDGIGAKATPDEVMHAYGPPSRVTDSVVSEAGEFPGAQDHTLELAERGLAFTFYDGVLARVAIGKPRPVAAVQPASAAP